MPMTSPSVLTSGPPESPGWISPSIWISPASRSESPGVPGSLAVI